VAVALSVSSPDSAPASLIFTGDTAWTNATLTPVAPFGPTVFHYAGNLTAPKQIGLHALTWQSNTGGASIAAGNRGDVQQWSLL
jgi:hypothetical protein